MKRYSRQVVVAVLSIAAVISLMACLNTEVAEEDVHEQALFIYVSDSTGAAVTADTVHWSYAPDPAIAKAGGTMHDPATDSVKRGALRVGTTGSLWKITDHVHGNLYLRASRSAQDPADALCILSGYSVAHFNADTLSDTASLTLTVERFCQ